MLGPIIDGKIDSHFRFGWKKSEQTFQTFCLAYQTQTLLSSTDLLLQILTWYYLFETSHYVSFHASPTSVVIWFMCILSLFKQQCKKLTLATVLSRLKKMSLLKNGLISRWNGGKLFVNSKVSQSWICIFFTTLLLFTKLIVARGSPLLRLTRVSRKWRNPEWWNDTWACAKTKNSHFLRVDMKNNSVM